MDILKIIKALMFCHDKSERVLNEAAYRLEAFCTKEFLITFEEIKELSKESIFSETELLDLVFCDRSMTKEKLAKIIDVAVIFAVNLEASHKWTMQGYQHEDQEYL